MTNKIYFNKPSISGLPYPMISMIKPPTAQTSDFL